MGFRSFLSAHKNNVLLRPLVKIRRGAVDAIERSRDKKAPKKIEKVIKAKNKENKNRKIKVAFIVIDPFTWSKLKSLYSEFQKRENVELYLICVPTMPFGEKSATYEYFKSNGYDCINAAIGENEWFDLKSLKPDYVIYAEPYNCYLPPPYKSCTTSKYSKLCAFGYGVTISEEFLKIRPRDFYRDVYAFYATSADERDYNAAQFEYGHKKGVQFSKYLGFTAFSDFMNGLRADAPAWDFSENSFRAVWTPRWTTDESIGGSNFFRYKDVLFSYADSHSDVDILFRPHPMALDNFIHTGQMTEAEVGAFREKCKTEKNISLDSEREYSSTFWHSDVLIGDVSSILVEYFITRKPIIFCRTENACFHFLPFFEKILDSCYVVNNAQELTAALDKLKSGDDELKPRREALIKELFGDDICSAPALICNDIIDDFKNS